MLKEKHLSALKCTNPQKLHRRLATCLLQKTTKKMIKNACRVRSGQEENFYNLKDKNFKMYQNI